MKLQVIKPIFEEFVPAKVAFNYKEIKDYLEETLLDIENGVVTLDNLKDEKNVCKELNALANEIDSQRKTKSKELKGPIATFENEMKELHLIVKDVRAKKLNQIDYFDEQERERKRQIALSLIDKCTYEYELNEKYFEMIELKDEYLKVNSNPTKVGKLITEDFKRVKALQDAEQMKIDTINMVIGAHNARLRFKFSFEDFERHINDETSLPELNQIVNDKVNQRLADEQAELERIEKEKQEAILKAEEEVKRKAREEAVRVAEEEEHRHQEELRKIEEEKAKVLWQAEFEKSQAKEKLELEQRLAKQAAEEQAAKVEREKQEALRIAEVKEKEAVRVAEEAQAKVIEEAKRLAPKASRQKAKTVVLEITGNTSQLEALKAYMDKYEIVYNKVEV